MKLNSCLIFSLLATATVPLTAATVTFDSSADYSSNFTPGFTSNAGSGGTPIFWTASTYPGHVVKYDASGTGSASFATFNTAASSTSFAMKADVLFSASSYTPSGLSFGFLTNIGTNNGYAAIFRFTNNNTADFRIFEGVDTSTGALGTLSSTQSFTLASGAWSTTTFYSFNLNVVNTGSAISFTGSIANTGGTQLGAFTTYTDNTPSSVTNTNVGVRMGIAVSNSDTVRMDNFTVPTAVPEPSTYAALAGAAVLALAIARRRNR